MSRKTQARFCLEHSLFVVLTRYYAINEVTHSIISNFSLRRRLKSVAAPPCVALTVIRTPALRPPHFALSSTDAHFGAASVASALSHLQTSVQANN